MTSLFKKLFHIEDYTVYEPTPGELDLIKNTGLFNKLDENEFNNLFRRVKLMTYKEGQIVVKEGDHADALYIIVDGSVHVFKHDIEGNKTSFAILNTGGYFGEQALVARTNRTRNASVEAVTKTRLFKVGDDFMSKIFDIDQDLTSQLQNIGVKQAVKFFQRFGQKDQKDEKDKENDPSEPKGP